MVVNLPVNKNAPPAKVAANLSKIPYPGELGVLTPPGKSQNCRLPWEYRYGPPGKSQSYLASIQCQLGHHWPASQTPFKWHFAVGPIVACLVYSQGGEGEGRGVEGVLRYFHSYIFLGQFRLRPFFGVQKF